MNIVRFLTPKSNVAYLENTNSVRQGLEKLFYHGYTAIPVISSDGVYIGTVTEGDFLHFLVSGKPLDKKMLEKVNISDIIRRGWNPAVNISVTAEKLFLRMTEQNFVPVVDDRNVFIGIVTRKDVMKYFCSEQSEKEKTNNI